MVNMEGEISILDSLEILTFSNFSLDQTIY